MIKICCIVDINNHQSYNLYIAMKDKKVSKIARSSTNAVPLINYSINEINPFTQVTNQE